MSPVRNNTSPESLLVRDLVELYLTFRGPELHPKSETLSARYLRAFAEEWGGTFVQDLKRRELIPWINAQECWAAPSTKKSCLNRIKALFGWALKEGDLVTGNPYARLSMDESPPRRALTDDEYQRAWAVAPPLFRRLLWFLRATGCRPGEAAQLEWPMIDWQESIATLVKHKTAKKTGKPRTLYFTPEVIQFLRMLQAGKPHPESGQRVFWSHWGGRWTTCQMSKYWKICRVKAGLPKDAYIYGLRHRGITLMCLDPETPLAVASLVAGHTNIQTTIKNYCHVDIHKQAALRAVAAMA